MKRASEGLLKSIAAVLLAFALTRFLYRFPWVETFLSTRWGDWIYPHLSDLLGIVGAEAEEDMLIDLALVLALLISIPLVWLAARYLVTPLWRKLPRRTGSGSAGMPRADRVA